MRKKFLLMTFLLAIIGFCGTNLRAQDDLQIATEQELRNFASAVNGGKSYEGKLVTLTDDITLTGEWTPIGDGSRDSKTYTGNSFKGTFDGGDHTISGLTITSTSGADAAVGLFGIVDGGTVENLNLTDVNINVASSDLAGAAIGMMLNGATADNITVSGTIIGYDGVGGIVGRLIIDGTISNCINNASVTSSYGGIGGIVGKAYYEDGANTSTFASVTKCTNKGTVTAPMYIGGIAGLARANVTDCINNGAVVGGTQTGGIIGQLIAAGTVSGNENKAKISGTNHLGGIIGDYSQSNAYTYYNVSIANNINRGELAATEQCAAIMGCNNIDGFTAMTATGNVSYYYVEGLELFGNPEDMVIDETNKFIIPVAKIDDVEYSTLAEAVAAAETGDEIIMLSDATLDSELTLPAGITFNGNGKQINGNIVAAGDLSFVGHTKVTSFNAGYNKPVITISEGACLEIIGTGRMVIGHGATFNINGNIDDAKTADKANLTPSLVMPGASFTGAGVTFNVTNAYISAPSSYCSSSSSASGTFDFNIKNSIWESAGKLAFESQSTAATVNFDLVESVLNTGSHLVFGVSRGEVVIDNSNVNVGTSRQIENQSTMTIKNGSVVNGAVATSSNAKNPGTLIVEDATYAVTGEFSGSDLGTGTLIMKNGASFTAGKITKANIQIDATGMAIGDEINLTADLSNHAGTLEVINNDNLDAEIINGKIVLVEKPVAKIGDVKYGTLNEALNAAAQTEELTTIQLLAGTHTFGNVKFPATLKNVTIVGADNKATIIKDSKLYSADGNAVTYKGITFDGIVFDNSSILFTGARNGEVVYEDWTIKKCDFRNLQSTDGIAAIHFNLAADETIKNFTFENNTITNVTSPSNTASGLRLNYVTGNVVIKDNETNNVAFNAVQIINSEVANFTFEGNILRSNSSSLANLFNVTGENIVITKNQFLTNGNQESVSNIEYADVSGNYWGGGAPTNLPEGIVYSSYYTTVESDGTLGGLVELPQGDQPIGYVSETTIWGETWSNARTSYVIKVKDAEGNVMGTSTLNPELYTFNGNAAPTWHISFDPSTDSDTYWIQEWTTVPSINNMPAKVALCVDGVEVNEGPVKFNSPDDINKIYAATADAEGKLIRFYNSIETIVNNEENVNVVLVRDVTGSFETFHNVTLYSGVEGGASITNTYSADYTNFNKVIVKNGVTLNMNRVYSTTAESVNTIEGTMNVVGVYYHSSDAKTEIKNGGKVTTGGMTIVRYNNNPESGIYIYGDGDDTTIEFSCQGDAIGAYSGTFYAKDAVVETKGLRLDYKKDNSEESDEYAQINAKFVDTKLSVSSELRLYKDAALTLNGATVTAGKVQIRENATPTINIDNSTIKANSVENLSGATWNAVMDEDGYVTFVRTGLAGGGTEENPYLINNLEDLVFFRDQVNGGNNYAGKYVALTADIDLNNEEWTPIGNNTNQFQGYFDGNNKTISNLRVTGNTRYKGFFGYIKGTGMSATTTPSVKDLTLDGVNVNVEGDGYYVGGLAGQAYTCNITNVTVKGNVSGVRYVGGLVGHVYTYFKDCHFIGNASCSFDALGGIAGAGDCRAYDCSVIGDITGSNWVGGIVGNGQEGTSAVGCYVKGDVKTSNNYYRGVGGIAGVAGHGYASSEFKNNYFDGEVYLGDVKVPAMIMGLVNANDNASIKATVEGNSWNTDYYDVNTPVYVVAEISSSDASLEDWITGASEELTKPRNNNLVMLESDLQYVTEEDYVIMSFSEVTEEQVEQALINNAVAKIGETTYTTLQKALDAAVAGTGNVTVEIIKDIDLTNVDWNPVTVSGPGYPLVTIEGSSKTITGLNDMLFAGTWAGGSGLIINNLTIANSNIVNDENDSAGNIGVGAFIGFPQASATITLNNCHLKDSKVEGGHWTGGLIGYAAGYAGTDGPVFMNLTITDCSVTGSTITGKGSVGGIIGHGSGNAWTNVVIEKTTVSGNTITSTGSSTIKAGAIMGTIGAAGQPTTVNGVTHTGGATVSATVSGNTVKSNNEEITTIYGRQGTPTGMLELNGGSYDKYPIEEGVAYAAPAEGYKIEVNEDGTYGVVVDPAYGKVAKVGDVYYETLAEAYNAATDGQTITLLDNITLSEIFVIETSITFNGNGKTLTSTAGRAINVSGADGVTIKDLTINASGERAINVIQSATNVTIDNVTATAANYTVNVASSAGAAKVAIANSNLTGLNVVNVGAPGSEITINGGTITCNDQNDNENYAALALNKDAVGAKIAATGVTFDIKGDSKKAKNGAEGGVITIDGSTDEVAVMVAAITYEDSDYYYSFATLKDAIEFAKTGDVVTLIRDFNIDTIITVAAGKELTIDLNGKTITGKDNTTKNFSIIDNRGNLTITDSSDPSTGKITLTATIDSDWNRYSAVIANNPGGKLTIEAGTLEHNGGTDMAYGIDNLTNGKGTYAETVINGGYIKSPYRGIRQFLNGIEAQNILTVNGGTIEGDNKSIWMQDPNKNANTGTLEVRKEANLIGDVYLYVTPNSTSWPVEVSIAAGALAEGSEIITGNVPAGYELKLVDGVYGVCSVEAKIGEVTYATLAAAVNAANEGDTITLVTDITFTEATRTLNSGSWYDGLYYIGDKSFTIDLASYTIGHDNSVNDYLLNFKNNGAKANVINLINGTIEAGSTAYCALATSSSNTNKITINTENINIINNNSNGSTIKVRGGVELNVNAGTVITGKDSYLGIECVASTVNIYDGAEIYMNGNTSYNGCLVGACANGTVNVYGGYGEGVKGGFIAMTSGGTINVAGGEWIANTDGTVGDNSNLYVLTAQNNKNESGYAGASIINVTGGTFRGGMDAWILNDANVEKAELNISGGNFNADPTSYVVSSNYKVVNEDDGTYTVEVDGFEKFYTAEGVETTQDQAAYSLMFNVTDNENNELSVKIGNKKPAQNSSINLVTPVTATFDGITFNVTSVADNGFNSTRFKTVTISEGVATIGTKALANMSALTDIVFPSTLKSIGDNCFYGYGENHKIKTITCYAEEAPVAASHYTEVPFQMVICKVAALIVPNAVSYEEYATAPGWSRFYEEPNGGLINHILGIGTELEIAGKDDKYTMIATITSMDPKECSIKIGNTKPAANSNAELVIPETVTFFEGYDFNVTSIPDQAFSSCLYFVGDLVIPQNVRTIGAGAFNTSHFVANETVRGTLTLNAGLVSIGSQAFKKDYFKGDLYIPSTVETIASNAFQYASFDGILTINGNIDCANAFGGTGFTELVLVEGVEEIKDSNAFSGMTELKEVVLPLTLQTIGMAAFKDDNAIEVIHTYATEVPAINSIPGNVNYKYAFSETVKANAVLYVHGTSYDDVLKYKNATNEWKEFQNIHLYGAVAQIEEVEYLTIQDAINAAQAGETITVIDNVELTETITVAADKEVVFDLNGKVVSYTTTEYVGEAMITNNGNLTINDSAEGGKLSYAYEGGANSSYGFGNSTIENKGVLTINAGTVENTSAAMSHASYAINTGAGATLNVEGGNILNLNGHAVRMVSFGTELNTVNINGGYIEGTRALQVQLPGSASSTTKPAMDLNITGGELMSNEETYNLAIYVFSNGQSAENVSVEISGGTFNGNVAVNAAATNSMPANAVAITGGTFNGDYGVFSYSDEDAAQAVISITGGTFATNYSEWYAEDEQYVFELNENGTYSVVEQTIFTQTTQLNAGWNWFSYYVNTDLETLENELGESAAQIKSHTQGFDIYAGPETWSGTLNEILPEQMYMINANEPSTLNLKGETIDHENVEIILVKNAWNWIGYPINGSVNLSDAFNGVEITIGDQIKSHNHGFAYYIGNNTWTGDLQVLVKGEGYMYHNTSNNDVVFTYNVPQGKSNSELKSNITTNGNYWIPNASQYPNNMTMTAMVDVEGGDYEVAAFVDGEVRGSARPIYVEPIDAYVLFLTIHGEGVEEMTFKFYDLTTGEEFDLNDRMNYSDDAIVGSLKEPYMFNRGTTGIGEAAMSEVNIYPNPTTTGTEINLQATCDTVEVFNALGVKVAEYHNVDSIDAFETAGIYVIRITNNGNVHNCRLAVK